MSEHATTSSHAAAGAGFFERHHFLFRRLHSLTGILPVGLFVILHLFTNAQLIWGQDAATGRGAFQHEVDFIHATPALLFIEMALWASIGFHAALGVMYMVGAAPNVKHYPYMDNWRYTLQRVTAWVALAFIVVHIATLRWRWDIFGWFTPFYYKGYDAPGTTADLSEAPLSLPLTAYALQYSWLVVVVYLLGAASVVYHWANGLWTAAITWGATISVQAQRRWGYFCAGLGVALLAFLLAAVAGALRFDLHNDTTPQQRQALQLILKDWQAESP